MKGYSTVPTKLWSDWKFTLKFKKIYFKIQGHEILDFHFPTHHLDWLVCSLLQPQQRCPACWLLFHRPHTVSSGWIHQQALPGSSSYCRKGKLASSRPWSEVGHELGKLIPLRHKWQNFSNYRQLQIITIKNREMQAKSLWCILLPTCAFCLHSCTSEAIANSLAIGKNNCP